MTNRDTVLAIVTSTPGLTDGQIRETTGIEPHQQVNQICRRLADEGLIERRRRSDGLIGNYPASQRRRSSWSRKRIPKSATLLSSEPSRPTIVRNRPPTAPIAVDLRNALFVIPCSASKTHGGQRRISTAGVTAVLTDSTGARLVSARASLARSAQVDESRWLAAAERYTGSLYQSARDAIGEFTRAGAGVIIISGGYGIVLAFEPIGHYDRAFKPSDWPGGLL